MTSNIYFAPIEIPQYPRDSAVLREEMRRRGFSDEDITKIAGGNAIRFFTENLGE